MRKSPSPPGKYSMLEQFVILFLQWQAEQGRRPERDKYIILAPINTDILNIVLMCLNAHCRIHFFVTLSSDLREIYIYIYCDRPCQLQANYTVRRLRLKHTKVKAKDVGGAAREVVQFQYTAWPDHDTPTNILQLLSFIKKSSAAAQVCQKYFF